MKLIKFSSIGFAFISTFAVLFQLALAFGAPWGEYAMGGHYPGKFPPEMRIAALIQGIIIVFMIIIVLARSGLSMRYLHHFSRKAIWFIVIYCAIGLLLNIITPSEKERMIWAPVLFFNLMFSTIVSLDKGDYKEI